MLHGKRRGTNVSSEINHPTAEPKYTDDDCQWMRRAWDLTSDAILLVDSERKIVDLNAVARQWIGREYVDVVGRSLDQFMTLRATLQKTPSSQASVPGDVRASDGLKHPIRVRYLNWANRFLLVAKLDGEANLDRQRDPLTQLPTRAAIDFRLAQIRQRLSFERHVALLLIDIDNFKLINDQHGHGVGDLVLKTTADRLQAGIRQQDLVVRYGGDEFVAILDDLSGPSEAGTAASRLSTSLKQPIPLPNGPTIVTSASIGVALFTANQADSVAIQRADRAMYQAKQKGRAGYVVVDDSPA